MTDKNLAVIVCGGRDFMDYEMVHEAMDKLLPRLVLVIQGEARGADSMARNWAVSRKVEVAGYPAKWRAFGKAAGMMRNKEMLDHLIELKNLGREVGVVAFPGGPGTAGMCALARKAGIRVWQPHVVKEPS